MAPAVSTRLHKQSTFRKPAKFDRRKAEIFRERTNLRGALHAARRRATARLPDAPAHAEGGDAAPRRRSARGGLAPDGLRFGGLVQPRVPPVGRRRTWCLSQAAPRVVSERRLAEPAH